jgi:hypothetical protein
VESDDDDTNYQVEIGASDVKKNFLFNLTADPYEKDNVYADHLDVVTTLRQRLLHYKSVMQSAINRGNDEAAYTVWDANGYNVMPWLDSELTADATEDYDPQADVKRRPEQL